MTGEQPGNAGTGVVRRRLGARVQAWPYWPALRHPVLRRLLPGYAVSAIGDGMSAVAIAWLALQLAPPGSRGLWAGAAVAAYGLPGAVGTVVLRRWMRGRPSLRIAGADATLRAVALGAIPCLFFLGVLGPASYVALIAVSSLLAAWGVAGQYTLVAESLPAAQRIAGNSLLSAMAQVSYIAGPALAGLVTAAFGPATVIAVDATSWAVLAASYARLTRLTRPPPLTPATPATPVAPVDPKITSVTPGPGNPAASPAPEPTSAWGVLRAQPVLLGLLALSFAFYAFYGPVEVALPVHVAVDLHGSAAALGLFWTAYGAGAAIGTLAAPALGRLPLWPTMIAIVLGWGLALIPLGLDVPLWAGLAALFAGGVIFGPWLSLSMATFQDAVPRAALSRLLAARSSLLIIASPLGTALGGPLVAALGASGTLLASGLATVALAVILIAAAVVSRAARLRARPARRSG
ncbi:MAG TPA: MFS transporter [Streptosporangiaceae bacterium]